MQMPLAFGILLVFTAVQNQGNSAVQACSQQALQCLQDIQTASSRGMTQDTCSTVGESMSCLQRELSTCPESAQQALAAHLSQALEVVISNCNGLGNETSDNECNDVLLCAGDKNGMAEEMLDILATFRIGDIYEHLDSWCSYQTHCLDDKCDDKEIVSQVTFVETVLAKMCSERENFRDTSCYQGDFQERMFACHDVGRRKEPNYYQELKDCVNDALGELPGCSRDSFFLDFFSFVTDLMVETKFNFRIEE